MTAINTILSDNWDTGVCTPKPTFIILKRANIRGYMRVVGTQKLNFTDAIIGTVTRQYYSPDSYDAYVCKLITETSEADRTNMIKAIKKICATYTPTSVENILTWEGGDIDEFNNVRWTCEFTLFLRKAGIAAY